MQAILLRVAVRESLDTLVATTRRLNKLIRQTPALAGVVTRHEHGLPPVHQEGLRARAAAQLAFARFDYHDHQEEKRVVRFIGAVACSTEALEAASEVNIAKQNLMTAIRRFRSASSRRVRDEKQVRHLLTDLGHARLNLVQAYRQVPIVPATPSRIGFSWILGTTRVRHTTRETALSRLLPALERTGEDYLAIREYIDSVDPGDLRQVEAVAAHMRANITWLQSGERRSICIHAPLPVLYPIVQGDQEPTISGGMEPEPSADSRAGRKRRSDVRLVSIPGTIDVHAFA